MQPRTRPDSAPVAGPPEGGVPPHLAHSTTPARRLLPLAVSAGLHAAALLGLLYLLPRPVLVPPLPPEEISVELVSEPEVSALPKPEAPVVPPPPPPPPVRIPPQEVPLRLDHATKLFSDKALNRSARKSLGTLALDARFEQICDVEAMEQIARAKREFKPERAVAYATADAKVVGNLMIAEGAAFLSAGHWYRLSFRCETTPDHSKVVSFDFATGGPVLEGRGLGDGSSD